MAVEIDVTCKIAQFSNLTFIEIKVDVLSNSKQMTKNENTS